MQNKTLN